MLNADLLYYSRQYKNIWSLSKSTEVSRPGGVFPVKSTESSALVSATAAPASVRSICSPGRVLRRRRRLHRRRQRRQRRPPAHRKNAKPTATIRAPTLLSLSLSTLVVTSPPPRYTAMIAPPGTMHQVCVQRVKYQIIILWFLDGRSQRYQRTKKKPDRIINKYTGRDHNGIPLGILIKL